MLRPINQWHQEPEYNLSVWSECEVQNGKIWSATFDILTLWPLKRQTNHSGDWWLRWLFLTYKVKCYLWKQCQHRHSVTLKNTLTLFLPIPLSSSIPPLAPQLRFLFSLSPQKSLNYTMSGTASGQNSTNTWKESWCGQLRSEIWDLRLTDCTATFKWRIKSHF